MSDFGGLSFASLGVASDSAAASIALEYDLWTRMTDELMHRRLPPYSLFTTVRFGKVLQELIEQLVPTFADLWPPQYHVKFQRMTATVKVFLESYEKSMCAVTNGETETAACLHFRVALAKAAFECVLEVLAYYVAGIANPEIFDRAIINFAVHPLKADHPCERQAAMCVPLSDTAASSLVLDLQCAPPDSHLARLHVMERAAELLAKSATPRQITRLQFEDEQPAACLQRLQLELLRLKNIPIQSAPEKTWLRICDDYFHCQIQLVMRQFAPYWRDPVKPQLTSVFGGSAIGPGSYGGGGGYPRAAGVSASMSASSQPLPPWHSAAIAAAPQQQQPLRLPVPSIGMLPIGMRLQSASTPLPIGALSASARKPQEPSIVASIPG